ncbi:DUF4192 domain-containing protein [Glycomyces sp. L485]|uniref:DUF4192 domain-containing protein n=1 Tax=Glycomyces sp. L485 TaxID=2909235 RepID=UPI001F4A7ED9|nr:DUF4192 domain-containing protein [Glycomyces sp. L485]MCH7229546.1 DUF4192 domain-containing protein [Glycomyces sp. L485]
MNLTETKISIKGPTDLITTVPLLLGFHPEHSLVVVGLIDFDLQCTFRVDLPGSADHLEHLRDLTAQLCRNECDAAVLIAYGEREVAEASLERGAHRLDAAGIKPVDRLRVSEGRWFSLSCGRACCPPEGKPVPESSAASCEVAVAGGHALSDRAAVAAQLDPAEDGRRAAVASAVEAILLAETELDWAEQRGRDLHTVEHWMSAEDLPDTDDIATLGLALGDLDIRDFVIERIGSGGFEANRTDLWVWLARHLEDELVAPAATVAGFAAYRFGNGVLALEAFEMALRSQPNYRLAQMLMAALQAGIPPGALDGIGRGRAGGVLDG